MIENKNSVESSDQLSQKEKEYFGWIKKNLEGDNENSTKVAVEILSRNYTTNGKYQEELYRMKMIEPSNLLFFCKLISHFFHQKKNLL